MERKSLTSGVMLERGDHQTGVPKGCCARMKTVIMENLLLVTTMTGVFLGFGVGFAVRETHPSESALMWIGKYTFDPSGRGISLINLCLSSNRFMRNTHIKETLSVTK